MRLRVLPGPLTPQERTGEGARCGVLCGLACLLPRITSA
jgi:hypothetical protein